MFQTDDTTLLEFLCETIWRHNLNDDHEIFMVFLPKIMNRVAAAMVIQ